MSHSFFRSLLGGAKPTFKLFEGTGFNGVDQLDPSLTINSITVTPQLRYKGGDANATNWVPWDFGETLVINEDGANPDFNAGSPLLGANDDSMKFNGGDQYTGSVGLSNTGTDDFVIEMVVRPFAGVLILAGANGGNFHEMITTADPKFQFLIGTGVPISTAVLDEGVWYHVMLFVDNSGSAQMYVNGVASGSAVNVSALGDNDATSAFVFGSRSNFSLNSTSGVAYYAQWKRAGWLDTHLQAAVAQERFNRLIGIHPIKAAGTAAPTAQTRATTAHIDKLEDTNTTRKLYNVGAGWLRMVSRLDSAALEIQGYLPEPAAENKCLQSEDLDTTWVKVDAGDTIGGSVVAPNKTTSTTVGIIADATDGNHGVEQAVTLTAVNWTFSVFAKTGDFGWLILGNTTIANGLAWFNLTTGAVGTTQAGVTAAIEDWGDGWYRCSITFTGTAAAHTLQIRPASADNDETFDGDGAAVNTYAWGAQAEIGNYMTSYVPTVAAAVTRNKDELQYKGDDGNVANTQVGTVAWKTLQPDFDNVVVKQAWTLSDGGASADNIGVRTVVDDNLDGLSVATAGNAGATTIVDDQLDGVVHDLRLRWRTDSLIISSDGVDGTEDTSVDIPDDLDEIDIGQSRTSTLQFNGVLSNFRIFKRVTVKS